MNKEDYKEYANRAPEGEEYNKFRDSLNTIHDINDIKFKPSDVELPDPSSIKLNLECFKINYCRKI